jgi:hypothetical protein
VKRRGREKEERRKREGGVNEGIKKVKRKRVDMGRSGNRRLRERAEREGGKGGIVDIPQLPVLSPYAVVCSKIPLPSPPPSLLF